MEGAEDAFEHLTRGLERQIDRIQRSALRGPVDAFDEAKGDTVFIERVQNAHRAWRARRSTLR